MKLADILDSLDSLDWIDRLTGIVFAWQHADWRNQLRRHGVVGVLRETASALTLHNSPCIYVSRASSWSGLDIERTLKRHGIRLSDRGVNSTHIHFRVEQRQHSWALYVLRRAGVPVELTGEQSNAMASAERYAPGDVPADHSS
jgi:hypothetical protein